MRQLSAALPPLPLAARASAVRSRTCGRQRLAFLAASATGGARKPNPSEGAEAATAAEHGGYLGEDRGAENAFNSPLWQHPIKMCAHGAHS